MRRGALARSVAARRILLFSISSVPLCDERVLYYIAVFEMTNDFVSSKGIGGD